ncbi:MAG: protein TolQ [Pseudomonadota bacterium]
MDASLILIAQAAASVAGDAASGADLAGPNGITEADFSLTALFFKAHWVVQGVMILLLVCSVWSWAVMIEKGLSYSGLMGGFNRFEETFWSGKALDVLYEELGPTPANPIERVFAAGMREWVRSVETGSGLFHAARDRIDRAMNVAVAREVEAIEKRLSHLATIGATAPFIGLFGTVWGIKNSFESIAISQNTSIAVVAPGIAEALVATAIGLFAAIPAVVAYNQLLGSANRMTGRLENFADEFSTILSRQLDKRGV